MSTSNPQPGLVETQPSQQQDPSSPPSGKPQWVGILFAVCLLGCGIVIGRSFPSLPDPATTVAASPEQGPPPRPVETDIISSGNGVQTVDLSGQVEPRSSTVIRPRTEGVVQRILVQPGDQVEVGTAIAILDDTDQRLALSQAQARLAEAESELARLEAGTRQEVIAQRQATLESAQARELAALDDLERTQELVESGALSQRSLIEVQAQVDAARGSRLEAEAALAEATAGPRAEDIAAQQAIVSANRVAVEQAQVVLERTRIQSATSGTVQSRLASDGDYLEAGDPILTIVSSNTLDIFLEVPEELSHQVEVGMATTLTSRAVPNWQLEAPITAIIPIADSTSRRQQVRIQLDNPPPDLVAGMSVQGELALPIQTTGFMISRDALTRRGSRWLVFAVDNDRAQELEVDLVADMGDQVMIAHPLLESGQTLVVQGGDGLSHDAPVKVIP